MVELIDDLNNVRIVGDEKEILLSKDLCSDKQFIETVKYKELEN